MMDAMRSGDLIGQSAFVGHVIMLVGGSVVTIAENRERRLGLSRRKRGFPRRFSRKRRGEGKTGFGHRVQVFLFECTSAALSMTAATAVMGNARMTVLLLLLVAAITLSVGGPRLA